MAGRKAKAAAKGATPLPEEAKIEIIDTPATDEVADRVNTEDVVDTPPEEISDELLTMLAAYKKHYPREKSFHVTSDNQVFLHANKLDALHHQKLLTGEIKTFTIE